MSAVCNFNKIGYFSLENTFSIPDLSYDGA